MLEFLLHKIARPKRAKASACQTFRCKRKTAKLYLKKYNFLKKSLAMPVNSMYTNPCCGMIAVKREVAGSQ